MEITPINQNIIPTYSENKIKKIQTNPMLNSSLQCSEAVDEDSCLKKLYDPIVQFFVAFYYFFKKIYCCCFEDDLSSIVLQHDEIIPSMIAERDSILANHPEKENITNLNRAVISEALFGILLPINLIDSYYEKNQIYNLIFIEVVIDNRKNLRQQLIYVPSFDSEIRKKNRQIIVDACIEFLVHLNFAKPQLDLKVKTAFFAQSETTIMVLGYEFNTTFRKNGAAEELLEIAQRRPFERKIEKSPYSFTPRGAREEFVKELNLLTNSDFKMKNVFDKDGNIILTTQRLDP